MRVTRICGVALALLSAASPVRALSPKLALRDFLHDSWTQAGSDIIDEVDGLAQAGDGYLWINTTGSLLRFDGARFSPIAGMAPEGNSRGVAGHVIRFRDGAMWVARKHAVLRWRGSSVETFPYASRGIVEAPDGAAIVLQPDGVLRLDPRDRSVRRFGVAEGLPSEELQSIATDPGGAIWIGAKGKVCRWKLGLPAECNAVRGDVAAISVAPDGAVYAAGPNALVRIAGGAVETLTTGDGNLPVFWGALLVDREGVVWIGTASGLLRIRGRSTEWLTRKNGLTADAVFSLAEDSEGDLWIGTASGVDRLRNPRALHLTPDSGLSGGFVTAVAASPGGDVWVGGSGMGIDRQRDGRATNFAASDGLPSTQIISLYVDRRGGVWAGTQGGVVRFEDGRFHLPWPGAAALNQICSIAEDAAGAVWMVDQRQGLWRFQNGAAEKAPDQTFPDAFRIAGDREGALWVAFYQNGIGRLRNAALTRVDLKLPGAPRAILADQSGQVWIGAGRSLIRIRAGATTLWGPREGIPAGDILGLADDNRGHFWTVSAETVARIPRAALDRSPDGHPQPLPVDSYDHRDGLRLKSVTGLAAPRIAVAADGRVWVPEQAGIAILDPVLLEPDPVPPPVYIEQITVDGAAVPADFRRFRGHELRIAYTGVSLRAPERLRFRYRIEPGGAAWTDAEGRREVTFVNLPPDRYRFQVTACNLDDVCNTQGAAFEFAIVPYFYQTVWAKLLFVAAAAALFWLAYRLRLRQMQSRFRLAAQERARVTREIHDTLLQGFAGVVYQLEAASRQFESQPAASKDRLERAITQADNALTEARKTLQDMRLPVLEEYTLPEALQDAGSQAAETVSAAFILRTKGRVAPLPYPVQAAMFLIGREAINNAVNHAKPSRITVHLIYGEREFRMMVHDDGVGFDVEAGKQKKGHFGVSSMGERAKQAGADFRIESAPGRGTIVTVTAPTR